MPLVPIALIQKASSPFMKCLVWSHEAEVPRVTAEMACPIGLKHTHLTQLQEYQS